MPSKRTSAPNSVVTAYAGGWITTKQTELLNALCPNDQYSFPRFAGLSEAQHRTLEDACTQAFYMIKDHVEVLQFQKLNDAERRVHLAICRKTFGFGKLMERMSRSLFWKGQRDRNGDLALNDKGNAILPPSVHDTSALKKGIDGLVKKGLIAKSKADDTRQGREGNVYAPLALHILVPKFLQAARTAVAVKRADKTLTRDQRQLFDMLDSRVHSCFAEFLENPSRGDVSVAKPIILTSVSTDTPLVSPQTLPPSVSTDTLINESNNYKTLTNEPPPGTGPLRDPERVPLSVPRIRKRTRPVSIPERNEVECLSPAAPADRALELHEDRVEAAIARVKRQDVTTRQQKVTEARSQDTIGAYHRTYVNAWNESYPGVPCPTWTERDMHIVRSVLKARFFDNIKARHDFLDFIVRNWSQIRATQFGWMRRSAPPDMPKVSFFTNSKMIGHFLDAYADRRRFDQISLLPAEEQELQRLLASGVRRDQALTMIGERRALSKAKEKETEVRRFNGDIIRRAEEARARTLTERRKLMQERALQTVKQADGQGRDANASFPELGEFTPELIELPPIDHSKWS